MATLVRSVDVERPVQQVYDQWARLERLPELLRHVVSVERLDEEHSHWVVQIAGQRREFDAGTTQDEPGLRIAWKATGATPHAGVVDFHHLEPGRSRITVQVDWEPAGLFDKVGDRFGLVRRAVDGCDEVGVTILSKDRPHTAAYTTVQTLEIDAVQYALDEGPCLEAARTREEHTLMESLLPHDEATARLANAGMMELGQTVCTARAPACERCPLAELCAWRAAGYPAYTGPAAPRQRPYAGSDREVRGRILHELRADELPVPAERITGLWPDAEQLARALDGLLADGLAEAVEGGYALPSG